MVIDAVSGSSLETFQEHTDTKDASCAMVSYAVSSSSLEKFQEHIDTKDARGVATLLSAEAGLAIKGSLAGDLIHVACASTDEHHLRTFLDKGFAYTAVSQESKASDIAARVRAKADEKAKKKGGRRAQAPSAAALSRLPESPTPAASGLRRKATWFLNGCVPASTNDEKLIFDSGDAGMTQEFVSDMPSLRAFRVKVHAAEGGQSRGYKLIVDAGDAGFPEGSIEAISVALNGKFIVRCVSTEEQDKALVTRDEIEAKRKRFGKQMETLTRLLDAGAVKQRKVMARSVGLLTRDMQRGEVNAKLEKASTIEAATEDTDDEAGDAA
jgi:hypothetical protein